MSKNEVGSQSFSSLKQKKEGKSRWGEGRAKIGIKEDKKGVCVTLCQILQKLEDEEGM